MHRDEYEEPVPNSAKVPSVNLSVDDVVLKHFFENYQLKHFNRINKWDIYQDPVFLYFFEVSGPNYTLTSKIPYASNGNISLNYIQ